MNHLRKSILVFLAAVLSTPLLIAQPIPSAPPEMNDHQLCVFWSSVQRAVKEKNALEFSKLVKFPVGIETKNGTKFVSKKYLLAHFFEAIPSDVAAFILSSDCSCIESAKGKKAAGKGRILIWIDEFYPGNKIGPKTEWKIVSIWPHGVHLPEPEK